MIPKSYGTKPAPNRNVEKPATPRPVWNFDVPEDVLRASREEQSKLAFKGPSGESGPQRTNLPNLPLAPVAVDRLSALPRPILLKTLTYSGAGVLESMVQTSKQFAPIREDRAVDRVLTAQTAVNVERDKHEHWQRDREAKDKVHQEGLATLRAEEAAMGKRPAGLFKSKDRAKYDQSMTDIKQRIRAYEMSYLPPTDPSHLAFAMIELESAKRAFDNAENKHAGPQEPPTKSTVELPSSMKSWFTPPEETK